MSNTYSKKEACRMLCRYHNLDGAEALSGKPGVETIMQRIHSIQYDPLNVVARNADLVLQARVRDYAESDLYTLLYKDRKLVDGPDKEMCIYNASDFSRFRYVRAESLKQVRLTLQYRDQMGALDILDDVRDFVTKHGRTGTKDISIGEVRESRWGHKKLSSAALDYLYNSGELCVADKRGTQKYFDLTERVMNQEDLLRDQDMTIDEFLEWYIERRLQSVGFIWDKSGGAWQGHFLTDSKLRSSILQTLLEKNKIEKIEIEGIGEPFYISKDSLKYMKPRTADNPHIACSSLTADNPQTAGSSLATDHSPAPDHYVRFLAPLDNLMWDRQMLEALFTFNYRWEVYTPVAKRKFGYYVLPVLYDGQFIARFEAEPVKKVKAFTIKNWWWEPGVKPDDTVNQAIEQELTRFTKFLQVEPAPDNKDLIWKKLL